MRRHKQSSKHETKRAIRLRGHVTAAGRADRHQTGAAAIHQAWQKAATAGRHHLAPLRRRRLQPRRQSQQCRQSYRWIEAHALHQPSVRCQPAASCGCCCWSDLHRRHAGGGGWEPEAAITHLPS
jgi:hypothetical protein